MYSMLDAMLVCE